MTHENKYKIPYHGGKKMMEKELLKLVPPHKCYVEPFVGGGVLFWAKTPAKINIINDKWDLVTNLYRVLKTKRQQFFKKLELTVYSIHDFKKAKEIMTHGKKDVKRAWAFYVALNLSFAHNARTFGYAFSPSNSQSLTFQNRIPVLEDNLWKLKHVQILDKDALWLIKRVNKPDTFLYLDPPYIGTELRPYKGYKEEEYIRLLEILTEFKGKFLLSSFDSEELQLYVKRNGWRFKKVKKISGAGTDKSKIKYECLTWNYPTPGLEREPEKEPVLSTGLFARQPAGITAG